ncbi:hypothetical protein N9917_02465 [Deltaproteobacteria bacterium]|nr:hypothetical protein [Deltaproteobacteria bacterium]
MFGAEFVGRLLGAPKALEKGVEAVSNGLDKLVFTDEEKADVNAAAITEGRKMIVEWMKSTQGQNLARRIIALSITAVWLLQHFLAQVFGVVAVWSEHSQQWIDSAKVMSDGAGSMSDPIMLILGFYFMAPHMGKIAEKLFSKGK